MNGLLSRLFEKKGIKDATQLSSEEQEVFKRWQKILSEGEVTLASLLAFLESQIGTIERQFKDLDITKEKIERLVLLHGVYSTLRDVISKPKADKVALEEYLNKLLSTP